MKPTMLNLMKTLGVECAPSAWWREARKNTEMVEGQDYQAIPNTRPKDYELTPELWLYLLMKGTNSKAKEKLVQLISEEGLAGKMVEGLTED